MLDGRCERLGPDIHLFGFAIAAGRGVSFVCEVMQHPTRHASKSRAERQDLVCVVAKSSLLQESRGQRYY